MISQLPNLLTLLRIAACPVLVLLLRDRAYDWAMVVFLIAGITDGLDGYIAKRYNFVSGLGAILDPIADKLLIASAYIMLAMLDGIPFWLLVAVMFRDLVIVVGYLVLVMMGDDVPMKPSYISKVNTFLQISLVVAVLGGKADWLRIPPNFDALVLDALIAGVLVTTVVSGSRYVWEWGIRREETGAGL
ncbi:MAG: CDP-alcohol phosphatidyltransferase family protein [Gammaproteobacteria bacterium]|nr:CDP-alcohol phosphatidyltransferase family protein [Gammaproteobacteria bacterium]